MRWMIGSLFLIGLLGCAPGEKKPKITVVYNNLPGVQGLNAQWGFSCLVEGMEKRVLFDAGGKGDVLISNMEKLNIKPNDLDVLVLSHYHGDHVGGVETLNRKNPGLKVFMPQSFPHLFQRKISGEVVVVSEPMGIMEDVYSTGEMGEGVLEQGLVINGTEGAMLIVGCAHPGIVAMVKRAKKVVGNRVSLVVGGFHLADLSKQALQQMMDELKALGVKRIAPTHCTGDRAMALFKAAFGENFLDAGCGRVISF